MNARTLKRLAAFLIPSALAAMAAGAYVGFVAHDNFSLQAQVVAHIATLLGAVVLKLSYVLHLNACKHLQINEFANVKSQSPAATTRPSEAFAHECCLTGARCL